MKFRNIITALATLLSGAAFCSCSDMLKTDTESYLETEGLGSYNAKDSLYSAMGVVRQLQNLGERYALLGELRGDLVEVPSTADYSLQEISNFSISDNNAYSSRRDYYSVINNCNFALSKLDTLIVEHNRKTLLPDYISIRAMRDWTYLQLALSYGKCAWVTEPVLSLEDAEKDYPVIALDEIIDNLITDLTPYAGGKTSDYGSVDGKQSRQFFISPTLLLADLLLYKNRYEEAAQLYYSFINDSGQNYTVSSSNGNQWETSQGARIKETNHLMAYLNETITMIPYSSDAKDNHPNLVNLTYNPSPALMPASWWMRDMKVREHYFAANEEVPNYSILEGDTRGEMNPSGAGETPTGDAFITSVPTIQSSIALIGKFYNNATVYSSVSNPGNTFFENGNQPILTALPIYRIPHLYLRYAEAANRAGKPTIAFAVLKYGLRNDVLNNETAPKINTEERADNAIWTNFESSVYDSNRGIASRGRGLGIANASEYAIPSLPTKLDSIEWVENEILNEMAAETAFEGNRFFDLLRISRHNTNPDEWFADKVSRRFDDPAAARSHIADPANRWLK